MNRINGKNLVRALGASMLLSLAACDSTSSDDNSQEATTQALVLDFTSDLSTGELRWMSADSSALSKGTLSFNQDSKLAVAGSTLFVLERYGADNLSCVDLTKIGEDDAVIQTALADGANPYDAVVVDDQGWLVLNSTSYLQKFDPSDCSLDAKVDLSAYQQKGEVGPHASKILVTGDTLLVVLQRLKSYTPDLPGLLVRLNAQTGKVIDTLQLLYHNPSDALLYNGKLIVASSGNTMDTKTQDNTRGIEIVDLATGKTTSLVDGVKLGGGAALIALDEANEILYTSVYVAWGTQPVKAVDLAKKTVGTAIDGIGDSSGEIYFDNKAGLLYVGDRTTGTAALKIYDGSKLSSVASDALPPYDVLVARW
jgi:hypothetical protein